MDATGQLATLELFDGQRDGDWQHWHRIERDLWISNCHVPRVASRREVAVRGEIDVFSAPALGHALDALAMAGVSWLALDVEKVAFFDAAGVRELARTASRLEGAGGQLRVRHSSGFVDRVLEMTGLGRLLVPEQ